MSAYVSIFIRAPHNYDADEASQEAGLACKDVSKAVQSSKEEADINTIVKRFGVTGVLPQVQVPPTYADFEDVVDYHTAQNLIVAARESFMRLPADIRATFDNDPALFVDYCSDPANLDEMRKMGLAVPEEKVDVSGVDTHAGKAGGAAGGGAQGDAKGAGGSQGGGGSPAGSPSKGTPSKAPT